MNKQAVRVLYIDLLYSYELIVSYVDCPRSGPGPVRALFADPGPGPQVQVQSFSDLDTSTAVHWLIIIKFLINIHIKKIYKNFPFLFCPVLCSPNLFMTHQSTNILNFWIYKFINIHFTFKMSLRTFFLLRIGRVIKLFGYISYFS